MKTEEIYKNETRQTERQSEAERRRQDTDQDRERQKQKNTESEACHATPIPRHSPFSPQPPHTNTNTHAHHKLNTFNESLTTNLHLPVLTHRTSCCSQSHNYKTLLKPCHHAHTTHRLASSITPPTQHSSRSRPQDFVL